MSQEPDKLFPSAASAEPIFGSSCWLYEPVVNAIAPKVMGAEYSFQDNDLYRSALADLPREGLQTYWRETLYRAHMAATMSMIRTSRLADAVVREHKVGNLLGWTACCRALVEAIGDSADALMGVALTLAEHHRGISAHLAAHEFDGIMISSELEDTLIHFTHARKLKRVDTSPLSHRTKPTYEYIAALDRMKIPAIRELYAEFCEFMHPAMSSTAWMLTPAGDGVGGRVEINNERYMIKHLTNKYKDTFHELLMPAFNPILLVFKVLHKFKLFPMLPELKKLNFAAIPIWHRIETALSR